MEDLEILDTLNRFVSEGRVHRVEFVSECQALVDVARSSDGRQKLALAKAVPTVLSWSDRIFPSSSQGFSEHFLSFKSFHLYVTLLRNLCAGNPINQEAFVVSGGLEAIARVVEVLAPATSRSPEDRDSSVPVPGLQIVLQLLGNVAGLGEVSQSKIWERFFPSVFEIIGQVPNEKVREPLCMLIYTCCRHNDSRCTKLSEGKGASIVALLLNRDAGSDSNAAPNEWLELLICRLCFANPGLPALFNSLGDTGRSIAETNGFTKEQACLFDVLNASLNAREEANRTDDSSANPHQCISVHPTSASFLVDVIRAAAKYAASTNLSALEVPTQSLVADVLGLSISITRILSVLDANRQTVIPKFASSGLIPLLLSLLRALGPPDNAKPSTTPTQYVNMESDKRPASPSNDFESFPRRDVYVGYRRDVVAVIANASFRNFSVQELVRDNGGLLVVLQQCMPDTNNPFLREWGLWAIRSLLEGNSANQTELADLEIKSTVPDSRLKEAGMTVEINPETGRPRLVNVASGTDNPAVDELM